MDSLSNITTFFIIILIIFLVLSNILLYKKSKTKTSSSLSILNVPISEDFLNALDSNEIPKIYLSFISSSKNIFNFSSALLFLFSPEMEYLICKTKYPNNLKTSNLQSKISMLNTEHFLVRCILDDSPYIVSEIEFDKRVKIQHLTSPNIKSIIAYPLKYYGKSIGVFLMNFETISHFTKEQLHLFKILILLNLSILHAIKEKEQLENYHQAYYQQAEKKFKKEIDSMQQQLILSGKLSSLGTLASGIAHEIRNPLTIIKMLVDELSQDLKNQNYAEDIQVIKTEIDRMAEIVNQFLNFARPKKLKKIKSNINLLIQETANFLDIEMRKKQIKISFNLYSTLPSILCDHNQIKQVFMNIILNAAKAIDSSNQKNGEIIIKTSIKLKENNKMLRITIEDNGPGISNEVIDHLFEPFITNKEQGIGLGLTITYRIIENHSGKIEAQNRIEGGAKFVIFLPIGLA